MVRSLGIARFLQKVRINHVLSMTLKGSDWAFIKANDML